MQKIKVTVAVALKLNLQVFILNIKDCNGSPLKYGNEINAIKTIYLRMSGITFLASERFDLI